MSDQFLESDPNWTDPDDALRELLERADRIDAMQETEGWTLWSDFLRAEVQGYQRRLLGGKHKDLLDYRYDAGVVEGIRIALGVSETLRRRADAQRELLAAAGFLANQQQEDVNDG